MLVAANFVVSQSLRWLKMWLIGKFDIHLAVATFHQLRMYLLGDSIFLEQELSNETVCRLPCCYICFFIKIITIPPPNLVNLLLSFFWSVLVSSLFRRCQRLSLKKDLAFLPFNSYSFPCSFISRHNMRTSCKGLRSVTTKNQMFV